MTKTKKTAVHLSFRLVGLSVLPIGLGILKLYLHYTYRFRSELLDYIIAAGAVLGGVFLFSQKPSKVILLTSGALITFEVFKAIVDYRDLLDVALAIIAVIYLGIPLLRHALESSRPS